MGHKQKEKEIESNWEIIDYSELSDYVSEDQKKLNISGMRSKQRFPIT